MAHKERPSGGATPAAVPRIPDLDIVDAYLYLLGRLLVLRQEHLDFKNGGFEWNEIVHRTPGGVEWANPNLDVVYSEAWIGVDEHSSTLIEVPDIKGRYYTIQILNGWGETIANINERTYPRHAAGPFLICLRGAQVPVPVGTERIDVPGKKARMLMRIALGADPDEAIRLQHEIEMDATGSPVIDPPVSIPLFTNDALPGADAFELAPAILASEPDVNPGAGVMQSRVRGVSTTAEDPVERARIDKVIRQQAWPMFKQQIAAMGEARNGWVKPRLIGNYGDDWLMRTVANFVGIWANNQAEVVYFGNGNASPLDGSATYTMTFSNTELPDVHVKYFWSVIAV